MPIVLLKSHFKYYKTDFNNQIRLVDIFKKVDILKKGLWVLEICFKMPVYCYKTSYETNRYWRMTLITLKNET